jgi:hypothetical protein
MSIYTCFDSVAVIKRPTVGRDTMNGVTQDPFVVINPEIWCSYQEKGQTVIDVYGQRQTQVRSTLYFAQDPGVEVNDLVVATDQWGLGTATKLIVRGPAQPVGRGVQWECEVERLRSPLQGPV